MITSALKILVVEDHKMIQQMNYQLLTSLGYYVDIASSGYDAIERFKHNQYDFIFMDIGLPDIDGCTVTIEIRKLEKKTEKHIPIVALTAHMAQKYRDNAIKSGMDDFITKPLSKIEAKKIILRYLS